MERNIIIVGRGLVGSSLALALHQAQLPVQLLEKNSEKHEVLSDRPISLNLASWQLLRSLNIFLDEVASPIHTVHISQQGYLGRILLEASSLQVPALGYVVPYAILRQALSQALEQAAIPCHYSEQGLVGIQANENTLTVNTKEAQLSCDLLVAADGTQSFCRELLGISSRKGMTKDSASIFNVTFSRPHEQIAYERFTKEGAFALLPLREKNTLQCVWTSNSNIQMTIDPAPTIEKIFKTRLGNLLQIEKKAHFPLSTVTAQALGAPHAILIGNAARTLYPLAAQGFNLALRDVFGLKKLLEKSGGYYPQLLEDYTQLRHHDQNKTARLTQLARQVSSSLPGLNHLTGLAFLAVDSLDSIKQALISQAIGWSYYESE